MSTPKTQQGPTSGEVLALVKSLTADLKTINANLAQRNEHRFEGLKKECRPCPKTE